MSVTEGWGPVPAMYDGNCVLITRSDSQGEWVQVEHADPFTCASSELMREIVEGRMRGVVFSEGVLHIGTEGKGLGVVTYEVDDPEFLGWYRGEIITPWINLRRVYQPENTESA